MYKKVWWTCSVVVLHCESIVCLFVFYFLVAVGSLDLKIPNVSCKTSESDVTWRFDLGVMWMRMLNGKGNGCSQWFLSLCSVWSAEKPLLAGDWTMLFSRKTFLVFLVTFRQWHHGNIEMSVFLDVLSTQTISEIWNWNCRSFARSINKTASYAG